LNYTFGTKKRHLRNRGELGIRSTILSSLLMQPQRAIIIAPPL